PFDDNTAWDAFFIAFRIFAALGLGIYFYVKTRQEKKATQINGKNKKEEYTDILDADFEAI
ncbi:MAG: hypothetical protein ACPG5P_01570, partial [Saprospiraceae bacterium]